MVRHEHVLEHPGKPLIGTVRTLHGRQVRMFIREPVRDMSGRAYGEVWWNDKRWPVVQQDDGTWSIIRSMLGGKDGWDE